MGAVLVRQHIRLQIQIQDPAPNPNPVQSCQSSTSWSFRIDVAALKLLPFFSLTIFLIVFFLLEKYEPVAFISDVFDAPTRSGYAPAP